jgi:hypothetical protein
MPNFCASEWENLFSRYERRRKCGFVKKKDLCRIFVPASGKTCFHTTSAAENAVFTK